jgi:hypothetical protein
VLLVSTAVFSCPAGSVYQVLNLVEATVLIGVMLGVLHLRARRARQTETPVRQAEPAYVWVPETLHTAGDLRVCDSARAGMISGRGSSAGVCHRS